MKSPPKPCSTATAQFSTKARELGLYLRYVSLAGVELLARIESEPLPMRDTKNKSGFIEGATGRGEASPGKLIENHLVEPRDGFYRITTKGAEYLAAMRKEGMV